MTALVQGGLVQLGLANAVAAALLAIFVALVTRIWRNPHFAHALWLLVLLRLLAPPLFQIPVATPSWLAWSDLGPSSASRAVPIDDSPVASGSERIPVEESHSMVARLSTTPPQAGPATAPTDRLVKPTERLAPVGRMSAIPALAAAPQSIKWAITQSIMPAIRPIDGVGLVWLAGVIFYAAATAIRVRRFSRAVRRSSSTVPTWLEDEIRETARLIGLRRVPRLAVVEGSLPPMVWSGWRPTLLVPRTIVESIDPAQRRLLLLHELLHIRRGDHRVRWFAVGVLALYWWNPCAWWAVRRLQNAEEECCDADVLSVHPQQSEVYGEALLAVCEFVTCGSLPAAAVSIGVERKNHLKRRMTMILNEARWSKLSKAHLVAIAVCGLVLIGFSLTTAAAQSKPSPEAKAATQAESVKPATEPTRESEPTSPPAAAPAPVPAAAPATLPAKPATPSPPTEPAPPTPASPTTATPPSSRQPADILHYEPLKAQPGDDETQTILKERYNAAIRAVQLYSSQYESNTTTLGNILTAGRSLLEAKLALAKNPDEQIRAREDYLEFLTSCWRQAKARLDIGGVRPVDEAEARASMFTARLELLQSKSQQPFRERPLRPGPMVDGPGPGTLPTRPSWGLSAAPIGLGFPSPPNNWNLPATPLTVDFFSNPSLKPLEPAAGDDELQKLLKERYNSALKSFQDQYARAFLNHEAPIATVLLAGRTFLEAELAVRGASDVVPIYARYLQLTRYFEKRAAVLLNKNVISRTDFNAVEEERLGAEIQLLQAKRRSLPKREGEPAQVEVPDIEVRIAQAELDAAVAKVEQTMAESKRVEVNLNYDNLKLSRIQKLFEKNAVQTDVLDEARRAYEETKAGTLSAQAAFHAAEAQVAIKKALLDRAKSQRAHPVKY